MKHLRLWLCILASFAAGSPTWAQTPAPAPTWLSRAPHLGDYDSELRRKDGRVDLDTMVQRLQELGVTTYYWLVWHAPTDWEDLKLFLPKAAAAHLQVWVYLVPPTEGTANGYAPSLPFKEDYVRWGEEIARLSLQQTNLTGWVVDDFYANHQRFTPEYVGQMQAKAKAINPQLAFLPLMYFPEITPQFVQRYHSVIDGVVVAYPSDREEIAQAHAVLNGEASPQPGQLSCQANTPSRPGDFVQASVQAHRTASGPARLQFAEQDDFTGPTAGYHFKQLLVNDVVLWEADVAGGTPQWQTHPVEVPASLLAQTNLTVAFRLADKKGVGNFGVRWRLKDLRAQGLALAATLDQPDQWHVEKRGPFDAGFGPALHQEPQPVHVPFVVMTAGTASEFKLRHGAPASPERMAQWLSMCLQSRQQGLCDGVVTYCLDKEPQSQVFPLAAKLFHQYGK